MMHLRNILMENQMQQEPSYSSLSLVCCNDVRAEIQESQLTDFGSIDIPDNEAPTILKDTCKHESDRASAKASSSMNL